MFENIYLKKVSKKLTKKSKQRYIYKLKIQSRKKPIGQRKKKFSVVQNKVRYV